MVASDMTSKGADAGTSEGAACGPERTRFGAKPRLDERLEFDHFAVWLLNKAPDGLARQGLTAYDLFQVWKAAVAWERSR